MTKDSICKDCVWRKRLVYQGKGARGNLLVIKEQRSCKEVVDGDMSDDVKVLECSEFERVIKKVPPPNPRRFHTIP